MIKDDSRFGVIIPLSWDSNNWEGGEDINRRVPDNLIRDYLFKQEQITFGNNKYPLEDDGTFLGYSRMITKLLKWDDTFYWHSNDFKIVFFISVFKIRYIIGFYYQPEIDWSFGRKKKSDVYQMYTFTNIRSKKEDIVRFGNYIPLRANGQFRVLQNVLKKREYAYITREDVISIFEKAIQINPNQNELKGILRKI